MYESYRNPIGILQAFHRNPYRNPCRISIGTLQAACSLQELWYNPDIPWQAGSLNFGSLLLRSLFLKIGFWK